MQKAYSFYLGILGLSFVFSALANFQFPQDRFIQVRKDLVFLLNSTIAIKTIKWGTLNRATGKLQYTFFQETDLNTELGPFYTKRLSYFGNLSAGHAWYKLQNLFLNDTNFYKVFARLNVDGSDEKESQFKLTVTEIPEFAEELNPFVVISEGKDLFINCTAVAIPKPNVTWVNVTDSNNMEVLLRGRGTAVLKIPNIIRHFNGQKFKCQALNNPNEIPRETKTTELKVNYAPAIEKTFKEKHNCIGDKVKLTCKADGRPKPTFKWTGPSRKSDSSVFEFRIEEEKEFGNYTCFANNSVGFDKYVVRLIKTNITCQPPVTKPTPSPTDDVHPGIIAGVVIAAILAIAGLIIAIIFWKRRKLLTKDSEERNERSVRMNAIGDDDNVYATTQQSNRKARAQPTVQYAAVDKSKKTKKKRPGEGELIYADLDHETPAGERPPSDRRSTGGSGDQPTLYADIGSTRQETPRYGNLQDMDSM